MSLCLFFPVSQVIAQMIQDWSRLDLSELSSQAYWQHENQGTELLNKGM